MREDFWEFSPTHKIIIAGNHKPTIIGTDDGIWRRIHLVPFETCLSEDKKDPQMLEKLRKEVPGILAWAVRGCLEWQQKGLQAPPTVKEATKEYRAESDEYRDFFEQVCEVGPDFRLSRKALKAAFDRWRKANSDDKTPMPDKQFTRIMQQRGYQSRRAGPNGSAVFRGIQLRQAAPN